MVCQSVWKISTEEQIFEKNFYSSRGRILTFTHLGLIFIFAFFLIKVSHHHYDVIAMFGRYPERNKLLNRLSTAQEKIYLSA